MLFHFVAQSSQSIHRLRQLSNGGGVVRDERTTIRSKHQAHSSSFSKEHVQRQPVLECHNGSHIQLLMHCLESIPSKVGESLHIIMDVIDSVHIFVYHTPPADGAFKACWDLIWQFVLVWHHVMFTFPSEAVPGALFAKREVPLCHVSIKHRR